MGGDRRRIGIALKGWTREPGMTAKLCGMLFDDTHLALQWATEEASAGFTTDPAWFARPAIDASSRRAFTPAASLFSTGTVWLKLMQAYVHIFVHTMRTMEFTCHPGKNAVNVR
jgi:hypothetical protein